MFLVMNGMQETYHIIYQQDLLGLKQLKEERKLDPDGGIIYTGNA